MSFKNAFKILLSKFYLVWVLLLYLAVMMLILSALSVTFLVPVVKSFISAGISTEVNNFFVMMLQGTPLMDLFSQSKLIVDKIVELFEVDVKTFVNSALFLSLIAIIAYRFMLGLYVIPMTRVLEGSMVDNAKYAYSGAFISNLTTSCKFSLMKMLITIIYDGIFYTVIYLLIKAIFSSSLYILSPFVFSLLLILILSFKYSMLSLWAPAIVTGQMGVFKGLKYSIVKAFKHFGSIFSLYIIVWTILLTFNFIIGLFTFGVGFIISIPISMMFLNILSQTIFFGKNGKRYYVEGRIFTPTPKY